MSTATPQRFAGKLGKVTGEASSHNSIPGAAELPQVNLLPDSVRAGRALLRTKLYLLIGFGIVLIVAILGYVASMLAASSAQEELEDAQADGVRLVQEQTKYAEVPQVKAEIDAALSAQQVGMGSEVLWGEYIAGLLLQLPPGSQLMTFDTAVMNPILAPGLPADALTSPGIGSLTITHRSVTMPDTSSWIDMLNAIPGFGNAQFTTASIAEEDGVVHYEVTTTVQVTADALSGRYLGDDTTGETKE